MGGESAASGAYGGKPAERSVCLYTLLDNVNNLMMSTPDQKHSQKPKAYRQCCVSRARVGGRSRGAHLDCGSRGIRNRTQGNSPLETVTRNPGCSVSDVHWCVCLLQEQSLPGANQSRFETSPAQEEMDMFSAEDDRPAQQTEPESTEQRPMQIDPMGYC